LSRVRDEDKANNNEPASQQDQEQPQYGVFISTAPANDTMQTSTTALPRRLQLRDEEEMRRFRSDCGPSTCLCHERSRRRRREGVGEGNPTREVATSFSPVHWRREVLVIVATIILATISTAYAQQQRQAQTFYVPIPEQPLLILADAINRRSMPPQEQPDPSFSALLTIQITTDGTVITLERDLQSQTRSTNKTGQSKSTRRAKEVWGDGNARNGCPPFLQSTTPNPCTDDTDVLFTGDVLAVESVVTANGSGNGNFVDDGDRIVATGGPVTLERTGSKLVSAATVRDIDSASRGTQFVTPVGDAASTGFYALYVLAYRDDTVLITATSVQTLHRGESTIIRSVRRGDRLWATYAVTVEFIATAGAKSIVDAMLAGGSDVSSFDDKIWMFTLQPIENDPSPSPQPSFQPTSSQPSTQPSAEPSTEPTSSEPSEVPSSVPSDVPSTPSALLTDAPIVGFYSTASPVIVQPPPQNPKNRPKPKPKKNMLMMKKNPMNKMNAAMNGVVSPGKKMTKPKQKPRTSSPSAAPSASPSAAPSPKKMKRRMMRRKKKSNQAVVTDPVQQPSLGVMMMRRKKKKVSPPLPPGVGITANGNGGRGSGTRNGKGTRLGSGTSINWSVLFETVENKNNNN